MRHARVRPLLFGQLLTLLGLAFTVLASTASPALADGPDTSATGNVDLSQAVNRALRNYGWRAEAIAYIASHTRVVQTQYGLNSPCPTDVACSLRDGSVYVNLVPTDPPTLDYVLNHEFIHAMEFARGSADASIGPILADVLVLSNDAQHPLAADAARRVLGMTGNRDHPVLAGQDWFHIEHYILEDVGWDVANLPDWYRGAYFPYLTPNPPARKSVAPPPAVPQVTDLANQRVLDAIVKMCGPSMPGARLNAPGIACNAAPLWGNVPYSRLAGGAAPPPPAAVTADAPRSLPTPASPPAEDAAHAQAAVSSAADEDVIAAAA